MSVQVAIIVVECLIYQSTFWDCLVIFLLWWVQKKNIFSVAGSSIEWKLSSPFDKRKWWSNAGKKHGGYVDRWKPQLCYLFQRLLFFSLLLHVTTFIV